MRRKWKYANTFALKNAYRALFSLFMVICFSLVSSCINKEKHNHIQTGKTSETDGLSQTSNQTVYSDVKTISPIRQSIIPNLNATGVISYDPSLLNNISARFSGRIEKLYVRFNFENVSKGQRIMDVYSPEILTEQQTLIFLLNNSLNDSTLINSSKQKLRLLGLTDDQLKLIVARRKPINPLPVYNPYNGHIHDIGVSNGIVSSSSTMNSGMGSGTSGTTPQVQMVNLPSSQSSALSIKEGMYVENGQAIFAVYNTTRLWAVLNIFPADASLIKVGDKVSIIAETNPGNQIFSTISYIEPVAGLNASAIKARVILQNAENLHLKIGTLLSAKISAREVNGWWLPRRAVVNLGQRQVVFLKIKDHFIAKNIQTGVVDDSLIQIISGLNGNEAVAANGQYMVDSESFIK